ncbi:MAG TPA: lytic murein transglycosylase B, partial [Ramlibacter sp.]|nr:lytic murein transglycosylase B [Ramlibacter sp.]
ATSHQERKPHRPRGSLGQTGGVPYAGNEEVMRWADEVAQRRGLEREWVRQALARAQFLPAVARLMQPAPAGTPKNWRVYRSRFIDPVRIAAGVRFWQDNEDTLRRAEQEYGVPPEIIVGIIGVETIYGQQMGNFRVLDALATLAFNFPESHPRAAERAAYFRGELEQFLVLQAQRGADPLQPLGSYAGAIGMAQFMPSSIMRWGVDFDGDGRIDLAHSPADVIGSVANYLRSYGWQPGMPACYPVSFDPARVDKEALLAPDILPTFSVASFAARGAILEGAALQHKGPLALVELQNGDDAPQYVAGTDNFYVITRFNWSSYYAMAVIELGQAVKDAVLALAAPVAPAAESTDESALPAAVPSPPASAAPAAAASVTPAAPAAAAASEPAATPPDAPADVPADNAPPTP